uniref:Uncharacterized protein n=1 Tax=Arundo donax TaxID=35708 RepID=A0A0A9H1Y8_ARUDO
MCNLWPFVAMGFCEAVNSFINGKIYRWRPKTR